MGNKSLIFIFLILFINLISAINVGVDGEVGLDLIEKIKDWTINNLHVLGDSVFEGTVIFKDNVTIITPASMVVNTSLTISDWLGNPDIVLNSTGDSWFNGDGNVGIGTASPGTHLEIESSTISPAFRLDATGTGGISWTLYSTDNTASINGGKLGFYGGSTPGYKIVIDNSGNVGIGTSAPAAKLDILGAGSTGLSLNVTDDLFVNDTSGNVGIGTGSPIGALEIGSGQLILPTGTAAAPTIAWKADTGQDSGFYLINQNEMAWTAGELAQGVLGNNRLNFLDVGVLGWSSSSDPNAAADTNLYRGAANVLQTDDGLNVAGNVGIGTASPDVKLRVDGGGIFNLTSAQNFSVINETGTSLFYVNGTNGKVGIGTGSPNELLGLEASLPFIELKQTSTFGGTEKGIKFSDKWGQEHIQLVSSLQNDAEGGAFDSKFYIKTVVDGGAMTERFTIDNVGNVGIGTTSPTQRLDVIGWINQTVGNFTGNNLYAQVCYHNHTATELNFAVANLFYNMTFAMTEGYELNGFSTDESHTLFAQLGGLYSVNYMAIGDGQNNHKYVSRVSINSVGQNCTASHKKMAAGGDIITMTGSGLIRIESGDYINLQVADDGGTGTGNYYGMNLNLVRIGN